MINFILVDDIEYFLDRNQQIIDSIMKSRKIDYKISKHLEYDNNFYKIAFSELLNKVYILDIETKYNNGIDIARKIRQEDKKAEIIFLSAYTENGFYKNKILLSSLRISGFIFKSDEKTFIERLIEIVDYTINNSIYSFSNSSLFFSININDIYYIDFCNRKCMIHTKSGSIEFGKSLSSVEEELKKISNTFIRTHKSCIVNSHKVAFYDFKNKEIVFKDKSKVQLLSKKYKNQIINK